MLSVEQHISAVVRSCFFHIISLSKVRPYITYKAASSIAVCLILSKLDYCNSLISGLPQKQIKRLQAVQNAAARTVMKCTHKKQITSLPFLDSFIGFPSRNGSATNFSYRSVHNNTPPVRHSKHWFTTSFFWRRCRKAMLGVCCDTSRCLRQSSPSNRH